MSKYIPQSDIVVLGAGMVGASLVHLLKPAARDEPDLNRPSGAELGW